MSGSETDPHSSFSTSSSGPWAAAVPVNCGFQLNVSLPDNADPTSVPESRPAKPFAGPTRPSVPADLVRAYQSAKPHRPENGRTTAGSVTHPPQGDSYQPHPLRYLRSQDSAASAAPDKHSRCGELRPGSHRPASPIRSNLWARSHAAPGLRPHSIEMSRGAAIHRSHRESSRSLTADKWPSGPEVSQISAHSTSAPPPPPVPDGPPQSVLSAGRKHWEVRADRPRVTPHHSPLPPRSSTAVRLPLLQPDNRSGDRHQQTATAEPQTWARPHGPARYHTQSTPAHASVDQTAVSRFVRHSAVQPLFVRQSAGSAIRTESRSPPIPAAPPSASEFRPPVPQPPIE